MNFTIITRDKLIWAGQTLARHAFNLGTADLPWRKWRTPYRIFLAEMLLVRTRADVVSRIYDEVFEHYPTIRDLAAANEDELKTILKPLGLTKRVPYIIKAAQYVCNTYNGEIPYEVDRLLQIPGVGNYTAVAEATFAYGTSLVPTDVNILRFVARLTGLKMEHKTKGSETLRGIVAFLSPQHTGLSPEKLLDFTRLICRPRKPRCVECPLTIQCIYFQANEYSTDIN